MWEWGAYLGPNALEQGVDVCVSSWQRSAPNTIPAMAKSVANYANSALIKMEAVLGGFAEGIALDTSGRISEGSGQNLFLVRDDVILHAAGGVIGAAGHHARQRSSRWRRTSALQVREQDLPREMLYVADEAFFAGTAVEITPIRSVDRITIGDGQPRADHDRDAEGVLRLRQRRRTRIVTTG